MIGWLTRWLAIVSFNSFTNIGSFPKTESPCSFIGWIFCQKFYSIWPGNGQKMIGNRHFESKKIHSLKNVVFETKIFGLGFFSKWSNVENGSSRVWPSLIHFNENFYSKNYVCVSRMATLGSRNDPLLFENDIFESKLIHFHSKLIFLDQKRPSKILYIFTQTY